MSASMNLVMQLLAVTAGPNATNASGWQALIVAAVTIAVFLTVAKLWFGRGQGDAPYGCRRRRR